MISESVPDLRMYDEEMQYDGETSRTGGMNVLVVVPRGKPCGGTQWDKASLYGSGVVIVSRQSKTIIMEQRLA